jgi:hypothetical protein
MARINGTYDAIGNRIYWATSGVVGGSENDTLWVHDPSWGIPNNKGSFQTWSGALNFQPTALEVIDGELIRADARGYTFRHDNDLAEDPIIDVGTAANLWDTTPVVYDYISSAFSFGSEFQRKWVTKLNTNLKSVANISVQPQSINDDVGATRDLRVIRKSVVFTWGDAFFLWGDPGFTWRSAPGTFNVRRFPRDGLRCTYKQIRYTNAVTVIENSDTAGTVTNDNAANTVTLTTGTWDAEVDGGVFVIGADITASGFDILSVAGSVLTVADPSGQLTDGLQTAWFIKKLRKGDKFHLENYTILYEFFGDSNTYYNVGDGGEPTG